MKIFIDDSMNDMDDLLPENMLDEVVHEIICGHKGCNGKLNFLSKQIEDGSAVICNKCHRATIFKIYDV